MHSVSPDESAPIILITGAGRGIGRSVAEECVRQGKQVVLVARGSQAIQDVARELTERGGNALAIAADVTSPHSLERVMEEILHAVGRLDGLVTCAASEPAAGPSELLALQDWQKVIDVDLTGTFLTCQAAGKVMLGQGYGRIVNVASFHVTATYPQRVAYVAAKTGVVGLTQALAVEWGGRGVTVNAVAPGPILTPRTSWFLSQDPANEQGMIARTPTGLLGKVEDVAAPILFLCSKESGHINGQTLTVDGGWTKNAWWGQHPWQG